MILDSGVVTILHKIDVTPPGQKPMYAYKVVHYGFYGILSYETVPVWQTEKREQIRQDLRIRVLQNRSITNRDIAVPGCIVPDAIPLSIQEVKQRAGSLECYSVTRAYHGIDDDSGEMITDLSLEVVTI